MSFIDQYVFRSILGKGGYGQVYEAECKKSKQLVAIKMVSTVFSETALREVAYLRKLENFKGVIHLLDYFSNYNYHYIVLERPYKALDMHDYITYEWPEEKAQYYFRKIVSVVSAVYFRYNILHQDIKLENILVLPDRREIKLIDFGCALDARRKDYTEFNGTMVYCPPEWLIHGRYEGNTQTVWCLGILLYSMLHTCDVPFRSAYEIETRPVEIKRPLSLKCRQVINICLVKNPQFRCTLQKLMKHDWISRKK